MTEPFFQPSFVKQLTVMVIIANDPSGTGGLNKQIKREGGGEEGKEKKEEGERSEGGMEGDRKRSGPSVSRGAGR